MSTEPYVNTVVQMACSIALTELDAESIDLVVPSPPYDDLRNYGGYSFPFETIADQLVRVIKQGGVIVWVVADATIQGSETGTSFRQALHFQSLGLSLHDTMIFRKRNPIPQIYRQRYTNEFEYMFVFTKGRIRTHNPLMIDCLHAGLELGSTTYKNYSKNEQSRKKLAKPVKAKKIKGNIWEYVVGKSKIDQEAKGHPAPFPYELAKDHIISWSNENDLILDPMCGSGTTCKAAAQLGRRFIGMELNADYVELAKRRVKDAQEMSLRLAL